MDQGRPPAGELQGRHDQRPRPAVPRVRRVTGAGDERKVGGPRLGQRRDPAQNEIAGAGERGARNPGDFF